MDILPPFTGFYNAIAADTRIGATHISIYMALLQQWNQSGGSNPFDIKRNQVMQTAKISSRQTYNKHMNELKEYGYINYEPSANQFESSSIHLKNMEMKT